MWSQAKATFGSKTVRNAQEIIFISKYFFNENYSHENTKTKLKVKFWKMQEMYLKHMLNISTLRALWALKGP